MTTRSLKYGNDYHRIAENKHIKYHRGLSDKSIGLTPHIFSYSHHGPLRCQIKELWQWAEARKYA